MAEPISVGLLGWGMVAKVFHGPLLSSLPDFKLTHVVERRGSTCLEIYPNVCRLASLDELLESCVELVVICTPSGAHYEHCKACLQAGKHVVCDKPFTVKYSEALELIALAKEKDVLLTVFQNRRWDADFQTLQKVIAGGQLGNVVHYECHYDRYRPEVPKRWRDEELPGSGLLYDLGSHLVDQAVHLFGQPSAVRADIRCQRQGAVVDDFFEADLQFADRPWLKVRVTGGSLVHAAGRLPRYVVHGVEGSFVKHGIDPQEDALKSGRVPAEGWGEELPECFGELSWRDGDRNRSCRIESTPGNYPKFYKAAAKALRSGDVNDLPVDPLDSARVIQILELAKESCATNRTVEVPMAKL